MSRYEELERYIGPDQLPEPIESRELVADSSGCLAVVWLGGLVLAFLLGLVVGLAVGRSLA